MKKRLLLPLIGVFTYGCASIPDVIVPDLAHRTLRISREFPGFEYHYEVCLKKFLGICTKKMMQVDIYDLRDEAMRNKLVDMGFVAKVREPLPQ